MVWGGGFGQGWAIIDGVELVEGWQPCQSQGKCGNNPNWHQYQLQYDGMVAKLLVDGVVVDQETFTGPINTDPSRDLYIGKNPWGTSFDGLIDEFSIQ